MLKYAFFSVFGLSFSDVLMFEIAIFVVLNIIYLIFFNITILKKAKNFKFFAIFFFLFNLNFSYFTICTI